MENRWFCLGAAAAGIAAVVMCACVGTWGYSGEERQRMEAIGRLGEENAENYVMEKYGFTPEIEGVELCMERGDGDPLPWANGYVLAQMRQGNREFKVHISGEEPSVDGRDDFQRDLIAKEGREFFEGLLGYEVYDVYLEYGEEDGKTVDGGNGGGQDGSRFPSCHEDGMVRELYETGSFEAFCREHPVTVRIDDCGDRDLTMLEEDSPGAAEFFRTCAADYGMKAILISYKSREDYERGYDHAYGRGGVMDYGIWNDGLYINSYGVFEEDGQELNRFELQERDGVIFVCVDKRDGDDLEIGVGERSWLEVGEIKGEPVSQVYSVDRDDMGEVTVFFPAEKDGRRGTVWIQHKIQGDEWRQYEAGGEVTRDGKYVFVTYHGIPDSHFEVGIIE